jgi:hypothetical protein
LWGFLEVLLPRLSLDEYHKKHLTTLSWSLFVSMAPSSRFTYTQIVYAEDSAVCKEKQPCVEHSSPRALEYTLEYSVYFQAIYSLIERIPDNLFCWKTHAYFKIQKKKDPSGSPIEVCGDEMENSRFG